MTLQEASTMIRRFIVSLLCVLGSVTFIAGSRLRAAEPKTELLWPDGAPGAKGTEQADKPGIEIFLPPKDKATGTAVVVCPGGGYGGLAISYEGRDVAAWLNANGIAGVVLKYRLGPRYRH